MSSIPAPRSPADDGRAACLRVTLRRVITRASQCTLLALAIAALIAPTAHAQFVQGGALVPGPSSSNFPLWGTIASPTAGVFKIDDGKDIATGGNATSNFARIWISLGTQLGGNTAVSPSDTIQYVYIRIDHKGVPEEPTNFNMQLNLGGAPAGRVDHLLTLRPIFSGPNAPITGRVRIALKRYSTDGSGNYPLLGAFTTSAFVSGSDVDNIGSPVEGEAIGWEGVATDGFNGFEVRIPAAWFHGDASRLVQPDGSGANSVVAAMFTSGGSFGAVATVRDYLADASGNNVLVNISTTTGNTTTVVGTKLAYGTQPVAANAYATLGAFTVLQQNADGTTVTGGTATISLAIASGPVGGVISGTTTRSASSGTSTFNDISFAKPGTYTLTATSTGILSATSSSFVISAVVPPAPTITGVTVGNAQLSVAFTAPANDGGSTITTYQYSTNNGTSWTTRATGTTASPLVITGLTNGTTYPVRVRAVNVVGSGAQSNSVNGTPDAPAPPANTVVPAVTGTTTVGQTLTTSTGAWSGSPTPTYAYQWQRCDAAGSNCVNLAGATSSTYLLVTNDAASTMRAVVTATNASGSANGTSAQTAVVAQAPANTVAPTISGTTVSGQLLAAAAGTWTGTPAPTYGYQWQRCDTSGASCANIATATASTYTLTDPDAGSTIRVTVTGTNSAGSATATAAQTATITAAPSAPANSATPAITGTTTVGQLLTAVNGSWTGTPAPTLTHQWQRCDLAGSNCANIAGETSATYTLASSDAGSTIRVVETGTNASGSASASSAQTSAVGLSPANTVAPSITGTITEGQLLAAAPGSWTGYPAPALAYQWQRCDAAGASCADVSGATASSYTLGGADVSKTMRVKVTGTNASGSATATATQTAVVAALPAPPIVTPPASTSTPPTIAGAPAVGTPLTADPGTWALPDSTTVQWRRCDASGNECRDIAGATGRTYTPGDEDAGAMIQVVVTATTTGKTQTTVAGPIAPALPSMSSRVFAPPPSGVVTPAMSPSDSIPADGTRYALIRIELFDASGRAITKRASADFAITIDGVAVATTVKETSTPGVYELELRSSTVNQVTIRVAVSGVLLKDAPTVRFVQATANLDIQLAASTETPAIGQTLVFTVDVKNLGPNAATGVEVEQKLSPRVRYVSSAATRGSYDAALGTWTLGDLALGESATLKITVTVIK